LEELASIGLNCPGGKKILVLLILQEGELIGEKLPICDPRRREIVEEGTKWHPLWGKRKVKMRKKGELRGGE